MASRNCSLHCPSPLPSPPSPKPKVPSPHCKPPKRSPVAALLAISLILKPLFAFSLPSELVSWALTGTFLLT
ncbi:conserved hypothetical protein [Ricinus communis]|uniref:Uncharacterized protein n=1 Tax=Ricinus communis TaxID=3988 RepID=B9T4X6_RICCO|nr:conserved hypothetical protein [Ricinus communis]